MMMFIWGALACLYGVYVFRLAFEGQWGGALVVLAMTGLFVFLCRRSYRKRQAKQRERSGR